MRGDIPEERRVSECGSRLRTGAGPGDHAAAVGRGAGATGHGLRTGGRRETRREIPAANSKHQRLSRGAAPPAPPGAAGQKVGQRVPPVPELGYLTKENRLKSLGTWN